MRIATLSTLVLCTLIHATPLPAGGDDLSNGVNPKLLPTALTKNLIASSIAGGLGAAVGGTGLSITKPTLSSLAAAIDTPDKWVTIDPNDATWQPQPLECYDRSQADFCSDFGIVFAQINGIAEDPANALQPRFQEKAKEIRDVLLDEGLVKLNEQKVLVAVCAQQPINNKDTATAVVKVFRNYFKDLMANHKGDAPSQDKTKVPTDGSVAIYKNTNWDAYRLALMRSRAMLIYLFKQNVGLDAKNYCKKAADPSLVSLLVQQCKEKQENKDKQPPTDPKAKSKGGKGSKSDMCSSKDDATLRKAIADSLLKQGKVKSIMQQW